MYAAVRVRGEPDQRRQHSETLEQLGLTAKNHCILLPETEAYQGMLDAVKDVVAYGTIDEDMAAQIIEQRGEADSGDLDEAVKALGFDDVEALVEGLESGEVTVSELREAGLRNVVRLSPPSKGYRDTRHHYAQGGSLGDRGEEIEELLERML